MSISAGQLIAATGCAPRSAEALARSLSRAMEVSIDTPLRAAYFLAFTAFESALYTRAEEGLNYSAERLVIVFDKYFGPGKADPKVYAHDGRAIANLVYGNRMGNGPASSGDGYRFRGRGFLQITGRANYTALDRDVPQLACVANPDALLEVEAAARSAAWFWSRFGCNVPADANDVEGVTRRINGGTNGLAERRVATLRAIAALTATRLPPR